ncbi:hypothetical protein GGF46_001474 [Coemansia sp. RSA 552]|nr:hypothetical protein GGF46_001474 [Coemansia sp. RSA 552]
MASIQKLPIRIFRTIQAELFSTCVESVDHWKMCLPLVQVCHLWRYLGHDLLYAHALLEYVVDPAVVAQGPAKVKLSDHVHTNIDLIHCVAKEHRVMDLVILTPTLPCPYFNTNLDVWRSAIESFAQWTGTMLPWFLCGYAEQSFILPGEVAGGMIAVIRNAMPNIKGIIVENCSQYGLSRNTGDQFLLYRKYRLGGRPDPMYCIFGPVTGLELVDTYLAQRRLDAAQLRALCRMVRKYTMPYQKFQDAYKGGDLEHIFRGLYSVYYVPAARLDTLTRRGRVFEVFFLTCV